MGQRLNKSQALKLLQNASLLELGKMADEVRWRLHPKREVSFVIDRNINYTNLCVSRCRFCAFSRPPRHPQGYVLSREQIFKKIEELLEQRGTQILLQGGLNPALRLEWFEKLFRAIKNNYPIHIHGLSPPEIYFLAQKEKMTVGEVLQRLKAAGLDSIPGGGAEILVERVRRKLSPRKVSARGWLKVMEEAHRLGFKSSATMMFGSIETDAELIEHLDRVRRLQDQTNGFIAFIPWSFQPRNTRLEKLKPASGVRYLRVLALSRIFLDNVPNLQASWVTQGPKLGQVALFFGANDFGSTMLEENVVRAAGAEFRISCDEVIRIIKAAGFTPVQRNQSYKIIRRF
jgi:cyclic dehypoxanthinyl futalosine synthase